MSKTQRPDDQFREERLLKQRVRELENSLQGQLLIIGVDIPFGTNWGNPDVGYTPPYCRLDRGWVYMGGAFKKLTAENINVNPLFILPEGFRPAGTEQFLGRFGIISVTGSVMPFYVLANGEVRTSQFSTTAGAVLGMGGTHFRAVS